MDFHIAIVAIGLAGKHRFQAQSDQLSRHGLDLCLGLNDDTAVALILAHFNQLKAIGKFAVHIPQASNGIIQIGALPHQFLRAGGVIPQARIFDKLVQFIQAFNCNTPVKDASVEEPNSGQYRLQGPVFLHASVHSNSYHANIGHPCRPVCWC